MHLLSPPRTVFRHRDVEPTHLNLTNVILLRVDCPPGVYTTDWEIAEGWLPVGSVLELVSWVTDYTVCERMSLTKLEIGRDGGGGGPSYLSAAPHGI